MTNQPSTQPANTFNQHDQHIHGPQYNAAGNITIQPPPPRLPQQRPPRAEHFIDRKQALADLLAALHPGAVITLCGPGGIGKTALAAEALWQLPPDRFPDGIIPHTFYGRGQIDLACEHIARTLGEEPQPDPRTAAQRALAGRQLLLFLDGAEEADDLPTLLTLRAGCGVLVTTRRRSDALATRQDVDPLPLADAITLLQAWGGSRADNTTAAGAIAELVGRLPLALRLVGRYLTQTDEEAVDYLDWLSATPLVALDHGQRRQESIPILLERSLQQVSHDARAIIAIAGCLALTPFDRSAIAAALALPSVAIQRQLGELVNYSLLHRGTKNYSITHALTHTYARERLTPTALMVNRLAAHFTKTIQEQASNFDELNNLRPHVIALLLHCQRNAIWTPVNALALTIDPYLDRQGYWQERLTVIEIAVAAAQAQHDDEGEGAWLGTLGVTHYALGKVETAIMYYQQALSISRQIGDHRNEGRQLGNLGNAYWSLGQIEQAINYFRVGLRWSDSIGDRRSKAYHMGNLGNVYRDLGQLEQAIEYYVPTIALIRELDDRQAAGNYLNNLGTLYCQTGQIAQAIECHEQALTIYRQSGNRHQESNSLGNLGIDYFTAGQYERAIAYH
jgi:tetratricopeptide (TPR) repeat protein